MSFCAFKPTISQLRFIVPQIKMIQSKTRQSGKWYDQLVFSYNQEEPSYGGNERDEWIDHVILFCCTQPLTVTKWRYQ